MTFSYNSLMEIRCVRSVAFTVTLAVLCSMYSPLGFAQEPRSEGTPKVILSKLSPPIYTPLARQAMIHGDVTVKVSIRPDGTIESVSAIAGPPMLTQAAVESAKQSQFHCLECVSSITTRLFMYTFELSSEKPDPCCCSCTSNSTSTPRKSVEVTQSDYHIRIVTPPVCKCPDECTEKWAEEHSKFRSPKCLYLWKCGHRLISIL